MCGCGGVGVCVGVWGGCVGVDEDVCVFLSMINLYNCFQISTPFPHFVEL